MTKHRGKHHWTYWVGLSLFAIGLGFLSFGGWHYFVADSLDGNSKTSVAREYGVTGAKKHFVDAADANKLGDVFGRMVAPRLGNDWVRLIGEGTKWHPVLNDIGIGHYSRTAKPGEVGNFATAAHRGGFGGTYRNIHRFVKGDLVYVQTNDGWYTYEYLQTKIVKPEDTDVISAVPKELIGAKQGGQYMTMTSCDPVYVNTNRIIVWFELKDFTPADRGTPDEISFIDSK